MLYFHQYLYYKRDAFPFNIVNVPNLLDNIPKKTSYAVFISQVLKYANACMEYRDFVVHSRNLMEKLDNQFYSREVLIKTFRKFSRKYKDKLQKFDMPNTRIIEISLAGDHVQLLGGLGPNVCIVIKPPKQAVQVGNLTDDAKT